MKDCLEKRLIELKKEFESGQKMLTDLDAKQANIRNTLLRISGAIQVLEELIEAENMPVERNNGLPVNACDERVSALE